MRTRGTDKALENLLDPYAGEVQELVLATRKFVLRIIPNVTDMVDSKSKVIGFGYGPGYKDMICSIIPAKTWVTLGIAWGAELPDPKKLMEGSGKVHRHVKLRSDADLQNPALEELLRASLARWQRQESAKT